MPQISPLKALGAGVAVFGQQFRGSGQVSGEDGLVGEIDVGDIFVELGPLLAFQGTFSFPFRFEAKHFLVLSALFRDVALRASPARPARH